LNNGPSIQAGKKPEAIDTSQSQSLTPAQQSAIEELKRRGVSVP
jgi:hypothetical protein